MASVVDTVLRTEPSEAELAYRSRALRDMSSCAVVLGPEGEIVYANDAAQDVLGIGPYVGRQFTEYFAVFASRENDGFFQAFIEAIHNKNDRYQDRCPFVTPEGRRFDFFVTSSRLAFRDDESYIVITCADVTAEEEAERLRHDSVLVFVSSIFYICTFIFIYAVWNYLGRPGEPSYLTRVLEVGGIALGFFVYKFTALSFKDLGLSFKNLAHNLKVDGIACLVIIAVFATIKLVTMNVAPQLIAHPEAFYDPSWVSPGRIVLYVFTAIIQEFLTRGIMQESLMRVITGPRSTVIALIMSTVMFASLHLMYSPFFMLGAAIMLGTFGIVYLRQRSIWGLALIHFTFGISAAMLGIIA